MTKTVAAERALSEKANALRKAKNDLEIARLSVLAATNAVDLASYSIADAVQRLPGVAAGAQGQLKSDPQTAATPKDLRTGYGKLATAYDTLADLNFKHASTDYGVVVGNVVELGNSVLRLCCNCNSPLAVAGVVRG
jgi:hypothetical protein